MSYIEEYVLEKLKADAGVVAIASTRTFPFRLPQESQIPAVSFIFTEKDYSEFLVGVSPVVEGTMLVNCSSLDRMEVLELSEAVRLCLHGSSDHWDTCYLSTEKQGYEITGEDSDILIYHCVLEFKINFRV